MSTELEIIELTEHVKEICIDRDLRVACAESCTGGLLSAFLTTLPGSSDFFDRAFITYSNKAKTEMLGVPVSLITREGAVSSAVAIAMAEGAMERSGTQLSLAITGIAGPGGGSAEKPVGRVHIAAKLNENPALHRQYDFGDIGREEVRQASVAEALRLALEILQVQAAPAL